MKINVPDNRKIRLIINSDAKNEADDQFAIVQALLSEKFIVKGIIGAHFGRENSMIKSYEECKLIVKLTKQEGKFPVVKGSVKKMKSETEYEYSEGARLIVEEALKDDSHPLYIIFLGAITDMACALQEYPEIQDKVNIVWIGGGRYPEGSPEFNLGNDILAANIVFNSTANMWQIPSNAYKTMVASMAELMIKVKTQGELGNYLIQQMIEFINENIHIKPWINTEAWILGDSPAVGVLLEEQKGYYDIIEAPYVTEDFKYTYTGKNRDIRVYHTLNVRFILEDMFAKLELFARGEI
ncbi:pyrimidine-specific ribonucleoside hydrolase RihA [Clostridium puniceum]|uniref:Pyrimidine-specific ribonucleoside hydrolase RihA n=1 Tax=Clostridium puniceum TaxID=29367 RepID=A0A1S8TX42_9CLOT|nr:nucleoside hydrolase [Clostridium puniceum]OOM82274.1 pyrimidine-specific ribonucleoside hydrolase RihA [Clostridium puniceum]